MPLFINKAQFPLSRGRDWSSFVLAQPFHHASVGKVDKDEVRLQRAKGRGR
jgi:hypothetical protein